MSFCTQDEVFEAMEKLFVSLFTELAPGFKVTGPTFPRISYEQAMNRWGCDKPDLRYGLEIEDVSDILANSGDNFLKKSIDAGKAVRAICVDNVGDKSRKFFSNLEAFAKENGAAGLATLQFTDTEVKGTVTKLLSDEVKNALKEKMNAKAGSAILMVSDEKLKASVILGKLRIHLADELDLREKNAFRFCWINDFPMFEKDEETGATIFSHNPFSMPQGGMDALLNQDPLTIKAYQYDIVCNGIELSSGAIRNHKPEIMYKAFEIAGYDKSVVDEKFGGMIRAFKFGAPPHGGIAPGVDRITMLLANEQNIREVICFPMNQKAQDLLMQAPCEPTEKQLKELHLKIATEEK